MFNLALWSTSICGTCEWPIGEGGVDDLHLGIIGTNKVFPATLLKVSLNLP